MLVHTYFIELLWLCLTAYTVFVNSKTVYSAYLDHKMVANKGGIKDFVANRILRLITARLLTNIILFWFSILAVVNPPPANSGHFLDPEQVNGIRLTILCYIICNMLIVSVYHSTRQTILYSTDDKAI